MRGTKLYRGWLLFFLVWGGCPIQAQASQLAGLGVSALSVLAFHQLFPLTKGVDLVFTAPALTDLNNRVADQGGSRVEWLRGVNARFLPLAFRKDFYVEGDMTWLYGYSQNGGGNRTDEIVVVSPQLAAFHRRPLYQQEDFLLEEFSYVYLDLGVSLGMNYVGHESRSKITTGAATDVVRETMRSATAFSLALVTRFSQVNIPFVPAVFEIKYRLTSLGDFVDEFGNSVPGSATSFQGFQMSIGHNLY